MTPTPTIKGKLNAEELRYLRQWYNRIDVVESTLSYHGISDLPSLHSVIKKIDANVYPIREIGMAWRLTKRALSCCGGKELWEKWHEIYGVD